MSEQDKLWMSTDFVGYHPVGTAAIVFAPNEQKAKAQLRVHLSDHFNSLKYVSPSSDEYIFTVQKVEFGPFKSLVLCDGNY